MCAAIRMRRPSSFRGRRVRITIPTALLLAFAFAVAPHGFSLASRASEGSFRVRHYDLDLAFAAGSDSIDGKITIALVLPDDLAKGLTLDMAPSLNARAVDIDGRSAGFTRRGSHLLVALPARLARGSVHALSVAYAGTPSTRYLRFDTVAGRPAITSYGMPYSAGTWWPTFDEPADKAAAGADIAIVAPQGDIAVSNGILLDARRMSDGRTRFHWREIYPIYPDVISVAIGPYTEVRSDYHSITGRQIPLTYYVYAADAGRAAGEFSIVPGVLRSYELLFGPYPFQSDKYGVAEMPIPSFREHQTIPSLGRGLILGTSPVWDLGDISNVIAHDLAHQWFGDSLTPRQWSDIWLSEGFANYAVALWHEREGGAAALQQFMKSLDTGPFQSPVYGPKVPSRGALLTETVFNKGAWILHMLRHVMGDERYFAALHDYVRRESGSLVDTGTWIAACERHYGHPLAWFFNEWLYGQGRPALRLAWRSSAYDRRKVRIIIRQVQQGRVFEMPVDLEVRTDAGSVLRTVWVRTRTQRMTLTESGPVSRVILDPDDWVLKR